ncbi:MAG: hypothetical protein IOD12_10735 [Silvanigrellales bacterium]|nr:hypothetical protein [Silvanigrellales bacterium]
MRFFRRGNTAFPCCSLKNLIVGSLALVPFAAFARTPQENFVELQALRYTMSRTNLEETKVGGSQDKNTLKQSGLATFPNRVNFVGHFGSYALQLTRSFNTGGSSYLAVGYVFSDVLELGLGANLLLSSEENLTNSNQKFTSKERGLFVGPYVLLNVPTDLAEMEVRWELDYGASKREVAGVITSDANGFESDLDVRFVFRLNTRVSFTTGANVFYKSVSDSAPAGEYTTSTGAKSKYSKSVRSDLAFGANLLGVRFSF